MAVFDHSVSAGALHAAVVPAYEYPKESFSFLYYATLINDSDNVAKRCRIEIETDLPLKLSFGRTNPEDNTWLGDLDKAVDLRPRASQTFGLSIVVFGQLNIALSTLFPKFVCDNLPPAIQIAGVNSIDFTGFTFSALKGLTSEQLAVLSGAKSQSKPRISRI